MYRPTLFLAGEAGPEDVAFSGGGKAFKGGPAIDYEAFAAAVKAGVHAALDHTGISSSLGTSTGRRDLLDRSLDGYLGDFLSRFGGERRRMQNSLGVTG